MICFSRQVSSIMGIPLMCCNYNKAYIDNRLAMKESRWSRRRGEEECNTSAVEKTTYLSEFSIPELVLDESMSKYSRETLTKLDTALLVEEVTSTLVEIIDKLLHEKIYKEMMTLIGEVLSIREEVTTFSREESAKQEKINSQMKSELRYLRGKIEETSKKSNSLSFSQIFQQEQRRKMSMTGSAISHSNLDEVIEELYDYMLQDRATKLFTICEAKIETLQDELKSQGVGFAMKLEEMKNRQRPINDSLNRQINEIVSGEYISKEVKKSIKINIRTLWEETVRYRREIEEMRVRVEGLAQRQREMEFSQLISDTVG